MNSRNLSNAVSTGGGGHHFEAHVQACFVVLMLSGGRSPCLPRWPIAEIKLQGKVDGYDTDDLIVIAENPNSRERRKLLCQIKSSISITKGDKSFGDVIQAAWNDFNNTSVFTKEKDKIALITGPLNRTDEHNVQWLLNYSKNNNKCVEDFFRKVKQAKFSPSKSNKKLDAFEHHLMAANEDNKPSKDEIFNFLRHFHVLDYDLGNEYGVILSFLHSYIAQFQRSDPQEIWARIVEVVQTFNQNAGTITPENLPPDLIDKFKPKRAEIFPDDLKNLNIVSNFGWEGNANLKFLALPLMAGAWNGKNQNDVEAVSSILKMNYEEWQREALNTLNCPNSPLTFKNNIWRFNDRVNAWSKFASFILDPDLGVFEKIAIQVLKDKDPAFELPVKKRHTAGIYGKMPVFSEELRNGIAEGLAILGSSPEACTNCSQHKAEYTSARVIQELFHNADWVLWGSLNSLLPNLAEASPEQFLSEVDKALRSQPCPFDELFAQENDGVLGTNYLTGLLWALEALAWEEVFFLRVCELLGELAEHDPGGQWDNRPLNSLATILLPWHPHTLASFEKHKTAIRNLINNFPNIAWNLLLLLLPNQITTTSGSYKPRIRKLIPEHHEVGVSRDEYRQQVCFYSKLAVREAGEDTQRLSRLIEIFDALPRPAFNALLDTLNKKEITTLPEDQRLGLWDHLTKFIIKHRSFPDASWALPDELICEIEKAAKQLAPVDPFNSYQPLFSDYHYDSYCEEGDWYENQTKIRQRREKAIGVLLHEKGLKGIILFAETVGCPELVGELLAITEDATIESTILPDFLDKKNVKHKAFVRGFILGKYHHGDWEWCDKVDRSGWSAEQTALFLSCLPFVKETWNRASSWLREKEIQYWTLTNANPYGTDDDLTEAVKRLKKYGRPNAAIECLYKMIYHKQPVDVNQCVQTLLAAASSNEPTHSIKPNSIAYLVSFLQSEPSVNMDDLLAIEWIHLNFLEDYHGATPKFLYKKLADDPEFFCEIISFGFRSKKDKHPYEELSEEAKAKASKAYRLLRGWKRTPGTKDDGSFCPDKFDSWLKKAKKISEISGYSEIALQYIGEVLIYTPMDPDGFWIHRTVASTLNSRDAETLREGYRIGVYNSRGIHEIDPTGKPERELEFKYNQLAKETEDAGFTWFATTLRKLADSYKKEAESIIDEFQQRLLT